MKDQKGITLVALVVTIIVLLILAGVTIAMVMGSDGIFNKANDAAAKTSESDARSSVQLAILTVKTNGYDENGQATETLTDAAAYVAAINTELDGTGYTVKTTETPEKGYEIQKGSTAVTTVDGTKTLYLKVTEPTSGTLQVNYTASVEAL